MYLLLMQQCCLFCNCSKSLHSGAASPLFFTVWGQLGGCRGRETIATEAGKCCAACSWGCWQLCCS